jgi:hypothetical protein
MRNLYIILLLILLLSPVILPAQGKSKTKVSFKDSLDHALDMSDYLLNKKGIMVVPTLITEPSVGYGAAGGAIYFHSAYTKKHGPPSMSGVLGGGTQNGTWFGGVFHVGYWNQDRIRYMGAVVRTSLNMSFYGSGIIESLAENPTNLNLDAWLVAQQIKFRIGTSGFFLGGRYLFLKSNNTFDTSIDIPEFQGVELPAQLSEATLVTNYDTRNNVFSPSKGFFIELTGTYSDEWMGGDALYGRISSTVIGYFPVNKKLSVGLRHQSNYSLGEVPFWARPIVQLRGAPVTKYQNRNTMLMEAEVDWNLYKRWSLVGFTGMGNAFYDFASYDQGNSVSTLGTGFRYLLMRKLGLQMGMDFATSSSGDFAFYMVFGCSWLR